METLQLITMSFKKELFFILSLVLVISLSQVLILRDHLEFGFSPDDVWLSSFYVDANGFKYLVQGFDLHQTSPMLYMGILYTFFGFNYQSYQIAILIFKILSITSLYLLIQVVFKNRLLSFLSGIIFSLHYGSAGSLEMVARSQDYLVITGINVFLMLFYLINVKKPANIPWTILASIILFSSFFINPIRAFPILPFICFIETFKVLKERSISSFYQAIKIMTIIFLPFILFLGGIGHSSSGDYGNILTTNLLIFTQNFPLLLNPFATLGNLFFGGDILKIIGRIPEDLSTLLFFFMGGPLIIFGMLTLFLSKVLSRKPRIFFIFVFLVNFILEFILFLIIDRASHLPPSIQISYNLPVLVPSTILGMYIISLTISMLWEWFSDQKNSFFILYPIGTLFAFTFIWFTWIFQYGFISNAINGYSTIPTMGISVAIASILTIISTKIRKFKYLGLSFSLIFLSISLFYIYSYSNNQIQIYLKGLLDHGMRASDQIIVKNRFWSLVKSPYSCDKFFYFENKDNYPYNMIMLSKFGSWYSLYSPYHSTKPCPVAVLVNVEDKLKEIYNTKKGGFDYQDNYGENKFFPVKDFYAMRLQEGNIIDIKEETLTKIRD